MSLRSRLDEDLRAALRSGDDVRKGTIRMLMAALQNQQIENRAPLDNQQELSVVQKEARFRREAADEYQKIDRAELVEKELAELAVLQEYLPTPLTEEEVKALVAEAIRSTGASSPRDMGRVMSVVLPKVQGRADGKYVSQLVRQALAGGGPS